MLRKDVPRDVPSRSELVGMSFARQPRNIDTLGEPIMALAPHSGSTQEEQLGRLQQQIAALLDKAREPSSAPRLYSVKEVCRIAHMSPATFWRRSKEFELRKIGRRTLVTAESVEQFLQSLPTG